MSTTIRLKLVSVSMFSYFFFFKLIGGAYYPAWRVAKEQQQLR